MTSAAPTAEGALLLGRYELRRQLGEGGMGLVYEVFDCELGRVCALKVLQPELRADPGARERFAREAAFAAGLDHPNVVRVYDRGKLEDGSPFYTMELLRGRDLGSVLEAEGRLPWPRARHIARQLCRVLALAHARGIVHRDLKPENCFLVEVGEDREFLKLLDFGIARQDVGGSAHLTNTGDVIGTALYMSPQQARGERADARADVYAVGVILYQMLAGFHPFERDNALQVLAALQFDPVAPLTDHGLPPAVAALVARAMHRDLEARLPSADALRSGLEALTPAGDAPADEALDWSLPTSPVGQEPKTARPPPRAEEPASSGSRRRLALVAAFVGVALLALALALPRSEEPAPPQPADAAPPPLAPPREPPLASPEPPAPPVAQPDPTPPVLPKDEPRRLTASDLRTWSKRQEAAPPDDCREFQRGYGATFRFSVHSAGGRLSLKRTDGGNTGALCARALTAAFARWAGAYVGVEGKLAATVRFGKT